MDGMDNNIQNGNVPNNDVPMTNNVPNADVVMDNNPNVEPVMNSAPSMDPFMNSVPNGPVMGNVPINNMDSNTPKKANKRKAQNCLLLLAFSYFSINFMTTISGGLFTRKGITLFPNPLLTIILVCASSKMPASYFGKSP